MWIWEMPSHLIPDTVTRVKPKAMLGVQLWRLYADNGRRLPAAWLARTVGISPTTMGRYLALHCPAYTPCRGFTPGRGWNWGEVLSPATVAAMNDWFRSNGNVFEAGGELPEPKYTDYEKLPTRITGEPFPEHLPDPSAPGLLFLEAIGLVYNGMAVCRMADCQRVLFLKDEQIHVGTSDDGFCVSAGLYHQPVSRFPPALSAFLDAPDRKPLSEMSDAEMRQMRLRQEELIRELPFGDDILGRDWMIDAVQVAAPGAV